MDTKSDRRLNGMGRVGQTTYSQEKTCSFWKVEKLVKREGAAGWFLEVAVWIRGNNKGNKKIL